MLYSVERNYTMVYRVLYYCVLYYHERIQDSKKLYKVI